MANYIPYSQEVAASAQFQAQNPGAGLMETKQGNLQATNPTTGATSTESISQAYQDALKSQQAVSSATSQAQQLEQQNQALLAEIANKPVAPSLNFGAINANAAAAAQSQVNPLYTQYLNQYLQQEAAVTQQQQSANTQAVQAAQSALANTQAQNTQQQQFTGANTALNLTNINQQAANREQNAGNQFDTQRAQLEAQIGQSNLGASGIGQQQIWTARNNANVAELQSQDTDQYNRNQQLLNESNTFAQIAQSNKYASTVEGQAESAANLKLSSYLQNAAYAQTQAEEQLTEWQQNALYAAQQQSVASQVAAQLQGLKGGVQGAAAQAWAPFLQAEGMPSAPTLQFAS